MAPTVPIDFTGQKQPLMGKSRKYSKGQESGFVPDYRHAVETIGESEGFGSSGRMDTEMTASEDSCAPPKRKCISLNAADGNDGGFGLPMQVLQLSRMSRIERQDLEARLSSELDQVRDLQKRIVSISSAVLVSPSSDIRSCSDGKIRAPVEAYHRPMEQMAPQGKKRAPHRRNGARNKKGLPAHVESARPVAASHAQLMKQCENLLNQLWRHQHAWVFKYPVDVVKLNIPDYFTVIKHPMDLGTVKSKIAAGGYPNPLSFAEDVRLTFSNAMTYNPPGNDVHIMAEILGKYFEQRWKTIEKKLPFDVDALPSRAIHTEIIETTTPMPPSKKKKTTPNDSSFKPVKTAKPVKPEVIKRIMTEEEKQKLTLEVDSLLGELPESIIDFLKEQSGQGQTSEEEIEIDFEVLSDDTLFALRNLVDEYLLEKENRLAKAEPCEMEILNEPGYSNSSLHPCKGNDMVDEDVDIVGGNDAPMSSFPPIEIEKDAGHKNSKFSSSSSSSSGSGSSSSDSDSASSSESESRVPKASPASRVPKASPAHGGGKEKLGSEADSDPKRGYPGGSEIGNDLNGAVPFEQKSPSKLVSVEEDERQEEESAPPERQVSPDKLYRAALLRNRFADTIFKAKQKALEKDDKLDPEKLRIEREELERRRKEEKARLQAEARAAEEARKKAEAEAAAEARRQRELEREAARQALQMMEKTVEINENSRFMEDLEMFRAGDNDHLPHFVEETSPERSHDELGSFKLQGTSNPLEQLGLFMKTDDDIEIEEEIGHSRKVEAGPSRNELGSVKLQESSNPMEQLGLFMKADDDTEMEEEIDHSKKVEEEPSQNELGSVEVQENNNPLEQLGLFMKADDDDIEMEEEIGLCKNFDEGPSDNEQGSVKVQENNNPLEQLGLSVKADDDIEMQKEEIDPSSNVEEGTTFKLQESSIPLEQLGSKTADTDTELEEKVIDPTCKVEEEASFKLQESSYPLEGLGSIKKAYDDIEMKEEEIDLPVCVGDGSADNIEERPSNNVEERSSDYVEETGPSNTIEVEPLNKVPEAGPTNDVEKRPSNDVEEDPSNEAEMVFPDEVNVDGPPNEVEAPPIDVAERPSKDDEEGTLNDVEGPSTEAEMVLPDEVDGSPNEVVEEPAIDVTERTSNDIEVEPLNKVHEAGPTNDVEKRPSNDVEEDPSNEAEMVFPDKVNVDGPPKEVEAPPIDVAECPSKDDEEGTLNDVEGPSTEAEMVLPDEVDGSPNEVVEEPAIDVTERTSNDIEEGTLNDVEGPSTDAELVFLDEVDVEGLPNEVVEGPPKDVAEQPSDDFKGPSDVIGGPSNEAEQVPLTEADVGGIPNEEVVEGLPNNVEERPTDEVDEPSNNVEGPSNDVEGFPNEVVERLLHNIDNKEGPVDKIGEATVRDEIGEAPDMEEGPAHDMEEGPPNVVGEHADDVQKVSANGVDVATKNLVEERTDHIETGTLREVEEDDDVVID